MNRSTSAAPLSACGGETMRPRVTTDIAPPHLDRNPQLRCALGWPNSGQPRPRDPGMPHYVSAQIRDPKAVNQQATALQSNRSRPSDKSQVPLSFEIEKSLRMSKSDMQVRPIYRRKRDSIEGPPDDRVRRSRRQPLERSTNHLVNQEIREDRTPVPHRPDPGRPTRHSPPQTRSPTTSATHSTPSATPAKVRTKLSEVRSTFWTPEADYL